jgi:hypothetical protein
LPEAITGVAPVGLELGLTIIANAGGAGASRLTGAALPEYLRNIFDSVDIKSQ